MLPSIRSHSNSVDSGTSKSSSNGTDAVEFTSERIDELRFVKICNSYRMGQSTILVQTEMSNLLNVYYYSKFLHANFFPNVF